MAPRPNSGPVSAACTASWTRNARLEGRVVAAAVQYEVSDPSTHLPNLKAEWRASANSIRRRTEKTCDAVNLARMPGTWAGIGAISCRIRLTRERMTLLRIALEGKEAVTN